MKTGGMLLTLAIALVVLGAGSSCLGYYQSLQLVTVTSTRSYFVTSSQLISTTSTETLVITTSSTRSILAKVFDLDEATATDCGTYDYVFVTLEAGQVHVSYTSESTYKQETANFGSKVDFWMLTEDQWLMWRSKRSGASPAPQTSNPALTPSCFEVRRVKAVDSRFDSREHEFTTTLQSTEPYYFVFLNMNRNPISVTLSVDGSAQKTELTQRREHTSYSTQEIPVPTRTVTFDSHPAGLGMLFFTGLLTAVGGAVLAFAVARKTRSTRLKIGKTTPTGPGPPSVSNFCANCGAPLPERSTYCSTCGSKIFRAQSRSVYLFLERLEKMRREGQVSDGVYEKLKREYLERFGENHSV